MTKPRKHALKAVAGHRANPVATILADQPVLLAAALGTLAIGLLARRGDLARGGTRMVAAHLLASAGRVAIGQPGDTPRPATGSPHLTDAVVGGMIGWAAEAAVAAVFDRLEAKASSAT